MYDNSVKDSDILNKKNNNPNYVELIDNFSGMSILVPDNWKILNREEMYKNATSNTIFIIFTDSNTQIQVVYYCKCQKNEFEKIYNMNITNMKNSGIKILSVPSGRAPTFLLGKPEKRRSNCP